MTDAIDRKAVTAISTINPIAIPMIFRRIDRLIMLRPLQGASCESNVSRSGDGAKRGRTPSVKSTASLALGAGLGRIAAPANRRGGQWDRMALHSMLDHGPIAAVDSPK